MQGHFGPHFMVFHRAWCLEFELALLSVVPDLKAAPYWDMTLDMEEGEWGGDSWVVRPADWPGLAWGVPGWSP